MWAVLKFEKKNLKTLIRDLSNKLDGVPKIYLPKLKFHKINKNKICNTEIFLLSDYLLCYHNSFKNEKIIESLKYCKGLKYFLSGYMNSQNEIIDFIKKCENHIDGYGYIRQSFFDFNKKQELKFLSGPFTNMVFKIISEQNNKIKILINNSKIIFSNKNYLFKPV